MKAILKWIGLLSLIVIALPAYPDGEMPQSSVQAAIQSSDATTRPYQRRLTTFSDSFDRSKKKVCIVETYPKVMSDEARSIFAKNGFEVVDEPSGEDVQIIFIEMARFDFRRGSANWVDVDYNQLAASNANDKEGVQKYLEGLQPPATIGVDAGVLYGATAALLTGAARGALTNRDARNNSVPYDQAMTLTVNVKKMTADGKTVRVKTIKSNVNATDARFLIDPSELYAAAIDCMITCE